MSHLRLLFSLATHNHTGGLFGCQGTSECGSAPALTVLVDNLSVDLIGREALSLQALLLLQSRQIADLQRTISGLLGGAQEMKQLITPASRGVFQYFSSGFWESLAAVLRRARAAPKARPHLPSAVLLRLSSLWLHGRCCCHVQPQTTLASAAPLSTWPIRPAKLPPTAGHRKLPSTPPTRTNAPNCCGTTCNRRAGCVACDAMLRGLYAVLTCRVLGFGHCHHCLWRSYGYQQQCTECTLGVVLDKPYKVTRVSVFGYPGGSHVRAPLRHRVYNPDGAARLSSPAVCSGRWLSSCRH